MVPQGRRFSSHGINLWTVGWTLLGTVLAGAALAGAEGGSSSSPSAPDFVDVLVEGHQPPAVMEWLRIDPDLDPRRAVESTQSRLERVVAEQDELSMLLADPIWQARPLFEVQRLLNGVAIRLPRHRLLDLRRLPEVRRARILSPKALTNSTTVPFLGVPPVWQNLGWTGNGIRVGVIDTGVDYLHTGFGGSGAAGDYAANDTTTLGDGFFPTAKVVGGWDFVGDAYDASSDDPAQFTPMPDPDPMDCEGHGSHVAGTLAAFGVNGDGTTYNDGYAVPIDFDALTIGPGVAPEASIYALRVFGCSGTSNVIEAALEWAVDPNGDGDFSDHLDVVNLSLASRFGAADDPTAEAADFAAQVGVVVVASAGNDGDVAFINGSPATADTAISVAAIWDGDDTFPALGLRIDAPTLPATTHQVGGANFGPAVGDPGITAEAVIAEPIEACSPLTNGGAVAGKIAMVMRNDGCTFVTQTRNAQQAGAVATVIVNDRPELQGVFNDGTGGDITIPPVLVRQVAGQTVLDALSTDPVELEIVRISLADMQALFSSRGPRRGDGAVKPDLAAPGVVVTSVGLGNGISGGTGSSLKSGTSMAAPHVAGLAALVRQARPQWLPHEIKAALMNTARDVSFDPESTPPRVGPQRMGSGRVQGGPALATELLAFDHQEPDRIGVTFGPVEAVGTTVESRWVRVVHHGATAVTVQAAIDSVADVPGVQIEVSDPPSFSVPAGGEFLLRLSLTVEPADLRHVRDPAQESALFGFERPWLSTETAYLELIPDLGPRLRVPIHAAVRPASNMTAVGPVEVGPSNQGSASLQLQGLDVSTGAVPPDDERSIVTVLELQHIGPNLPEAPDRLEPALLGVGPTSVDGEPALVFGVATHGFVSTPSEIEVGIYLDVDEDGSDDFLLYGSDWGSFSFGVFANDGFISVLRNLDTEEEFAQAPLGLLSPSDWHTVPFQSSFQTLAVKLSDLGGFSGTVAWRVEISDAGAGNLIASPDFGLPGLPGHLNPSDLPEPILADLRAAHAPRGPVPAPSPTLTYEPGRPGVQALPGLGGFPIFFDLNGASLELDYDLDAFAEHGSLGILLLHHHNASGLNTVGPGLAPQAEAVALDGPFANLTVTLAASPDPVAFDASAVYTAIVSNIGSQTAGNVGLTIQLDPRLTPDPASFEPGCVLNGLVLECPALGDLAPSASLAVSFAAQVAALPGDLLALDAEVAVGTGLEVHLLDNRTEFEHRVSVRVPIAVPTLGTGALVILALCLVLCAAIRLHGLRSIG